MSQEEDRAEAAHMPLEANERAEAQRRAEAALQEKQKRAGAKRDPFLRAANEDDDGYDPYSDRIVRESPYEEDPWR